MLEAAPPTGKLGGEASEVRGIPKKKMETHIDYWLSAAAGRLNACEVAG